MSTYIEYTLDDGMTIWVEIPEAESDGIVKASRTSDGNLIIKASQRFGEALESIRAQAIVLQHRLEDARADEIEVKFALKATGQAGNFAIGNVGAEAAYEITLKWKNEKNSKPASDKS